MVVYPFLSLNNLYRSTFQPNLLACFNTQMGVVLTKEAYQQLDYAFDQGGNFIDTAEMYPVPAKATTDGWTESYP